MNLLIPNSWGRKCKGKHESGKSSIFTHFPLKQRLRYSAPYGLYSPEMALFFNPDQVQEEFW